MLVSAAVVLYGKGSGRTLNFRSLVVLSLLLGATAYFARFVHPFYPLQHWLFGIYARYWAYCALFGVACLSSGHWLLRRLLPVPPRLGERAALSMALGVLLFFLGLFVGGVLGLYGKVFFFAWPLLLTLATGRELWRTLVRMNRRRAGLGVRLRTPLDLAAFALLILGVVGTYLVIIVPLNIGADAHWYHLSIAERYATAGGITRFDDGWYLGVYPQLASILYAWAFQSPGGLTDHTALAAHLEWFLFLLTLAGIAPLTRRLLRRGNATWAGAMVFLFPGILLYDSSLISGADHVLAFWAAPLAIAFIRCGIDFEVRNVVLASLLLSAALLTKYQACYFLVAGGLFLVGMALKTRRFALLGVAVAVGLVTTSPHWLKNLIFHGDPMYPLLHKRLSVRPFYPGAAQALQEIYFPDQFMLHGTLWEKLRDTVVSVVSFSFVPHDWDFHGQKPIFGSLFTLSLLALPFVRARLRLWLLVLGVHVGVATWFVTSHEDRFLQALLPWMVACTVAILSSTWKEMPLARVGVACLVSFQLVWGSDVYFFRTHSMAGESPVKLAVDLIASGNQGRYDPAQRFRIAGDIQDVGPKLPPSAVILLHHDTGHLGAGHPIVTDFRGFQGAVEYLNDDSPQRVFELWRSMRVTHVLWRSQYGGFSPDDLAREAVFSRAIASYAEQQFSAASFTVAVLKLEPTKQEPSPARILWAGCGDERAIALFSAAGLAKNQPLREFPKLAEQPASDLLALFGEVNAAVIRPACNNLPEVNRFVEQNFHRTTTAGEAQVFIR